MEYVCDAPGDRTWFRLVTEGEAAVESDAMRHAVEKHFRRERERAAESFQPISTVFIEQDIGKESHIQRTMPLFLTLRDQDGKSLVTAMLPPGGRRDPDFACIIVGPGQCRSVSPSTATPSRRWASISACGWNARAATPIAVEPEKDQSMGTTIEHFAKQCHDALKTQPGTAGREKVRDLVGQVLQDRDFVNTYIPEGTPERQGAVRRSRTRLHHPGARL